MSDIVYKNFSFSIPFLRGYRALRMPIMDESGTPAWPDMFDTARIREIRATVGERHFSSQMMLDFVPYNRVVLDPGRIKIYDAEFDSRRACIGEYAITGACAYWDPSSGRAGRDNSVCVMLYRDDALRRVFIHDVIYISPPEQEVAPVAWQCNCVLDFLGRYDMRRIAMETNGIGGTLPEILQTIARNRGMGIVIERINNTKSKSVRICDAIEPFLGSGNMYAHSRVGQTPLYCEMIGWSAQGAEHDDGLDALAGAICATVTPVRKSVTQIHANTKFNI